MFLIRKAKVSDLDGIYKAIHSVFITNKNRGNNGFLRGKHSRKFYTYYIHNSRFFYVAITGTNIIGFLFAYPSKIMKPEDEVNRYMMKEFQGMKYIFISQIGIMPEYQRQHIGKKLYKLLIKKSDVPILTTIASNPPNKPSEKFHIKLGFSKIGIINKSDGTSSLIYELR